MRLRALVIGLAFLCYASGATAQSLEDSVAVQLRAMLGWPPNKPIQVSRNYSRWFKDAVFYRSVDRIIDAPDRYVAVVAIHGKLFPVRSTDDLPGVWDAMHPPAGDNISLPSACWQLLSLTGRIPDEVQVLRHPTDLPKTLLDDDSIRIASKSIHPPSSVVRGNSAVYSFFFRYSWFLVRASCELDKERFSASVTWLANGNRV